MLQIVNPDAPAGGGPATLQDAGPDLADQVEQEVLKGLPNELARLNDARVARDYYELRNADHFQPREAETTADFIARPKRYFPFARRVTQVLAKHLYSPGPGRQIRGQAAATGWLNEAYSDVHANARWQRADQLATLGGAAAIQVGASGDPARPLSLQVWGADEVAVWPDVGRPQVVVTIDLFDCQRQYTLWTAERYRVYRSKKFDGQTSGAVQPVPWGDWQPNPYKCLPFGWAHADMPVTSHWEGALGNYLVDANATADDEASDLAHAVKKFAYPLGVAENCSPEFQVINKFGAFLRLNQITRQLAEGANLPPARLSYLQAQLDIQGSWHNIVEGMMQALDNLGIPRQAWRLESAQVASGIAILAEQLPLLERARERREPFRSYEADLARAALMVGGNFYNRPELVGAAEDLQLILTWPEPQIPLPGTERDAADDWEMNAGLKSRVMVVMERYGLTRDQAIDRLKQVAKDEEEADALSPPEPAAPPGQAAPEPGQDEEPADEDPEHLGDD